MKTVETNQTEPAEPAIKVGARVKVVLNGRPQNWEIVQPGQSDPVAGKIANDAPLVHLLLNRGVGEEIHGEIHGRPVTLKIEEVLIS